MLFEGVLKESCILGGVELMGYGRIVFGIAEGLRIRLFLRSVCEARTYGAFGCVAAVAKFCCLKRLVCKIESGFGAGIS